MKGRPYTTTFGPCQPQVHPTILLRPAGPVCG